MYMYMYLVHVQRSCHHLPFTGQGGPQGAAVRVLDIVPPPTDQPSTEQPAADEDVGTFFLNRWIFTLRRAG